VSIQYSVEQAYEILRGKNILPEVLQEELAITPLKTLAKKYHIGHIRLSACAHALNLYTTSKKAKIANTLSNNYIEKQKQNTQKLDVTAVLESLQIYMLPTVSKKFSVSEDWLRELCVTHSIEPLPFQRFNQLKNERRKNILNKKQSLNMVRL
jgi:hypothetical protein